VPKKLPGNPGALKGQFADPEKIRELARRGEAGSGSEPSEGADGEGCNVFPCVSMAERVGFEPTVPCGTHAFQACALSHSAISPGL
jgi:hypothetical protein